jgi:hypothetical protein
MRYGLDRSMRRRVQRFCKVPIRDSEDGHMPCCNPETVGRQIEKASISVGQNNDLNKRPPLDDHPIGIPKGAAPESMRFVESKRLMFRKIFKRGDVKMGLAGGHTFECPEIDMALIFSFAVKRLT